MCLLIICYALPPLIVEIFLWSWELCELNLLPTVLDNWVRYACSQRLDFRLVHIVGICWEILQGIHRRLGDTWVHLKEVILLWLEKYFCLCWREVAFHFILRWPFFSLLLPKITGWELDFLVLLTSDFKFKLITFKDLHGLIWNKNRTKLLQNQTL